MKNELIQKMILTILNRLESVFLREATLAAEVEISIDRTLKACGCNPNLLFGNISCFALFSLYGKRKNAPKPNASGRTMRGTT